MGWNNLSSWLKALIFGIGGVIFSSIGWLLFSIFTKTNMGFGESGLGLLTIIYLFIVQLVTLPFSWILPFIKSSNECFIICEYTQAGIIFNVVIWGIIGFLSYKFKGENKQ
jgi:hypothetical protein